MVMIINCRELYLFPLPLDSLQLRLQTGAGCWGEGGGKQQVETHYGMLTEDTWHAESQHVLLGTGMRKKAACARMLR